jgi:hypothetical protein
MIALRNVMGPAARVGLKLSPGLLHGIADARGLVNIADIGLDLRPVVFPTIIVSGADVSLTPGEETPVTLAVPDLPPNADVKSIAAKLLVAAESTPAAPETTDVTVTSGSGTAASSNAFRVAVTPPLLPRNVQVRLDGGEPLWDHAGTLDAGEHDIGTNFADAANAYLDTVQLPVGTPTALTFLVRSDTPGRVGIRLIEDSLDYTLLQTQTWPNPLDGSIRIDRNLELDFGSVARIPLDPLTPPPPRALPFAGLRLDVSGDAAPERLLGDVPRHDGRQFATVSPDYSVAQGVAIASGTDTGLGFDPGGTVRVAGVASITEVDEPTELYVEVRPDEDGAPSSAAPLGGVSFELAPREEGVPLRWAYAQFPEAVEMAVDTPHWIVMRGIRGAARLAIGTLSGGYLGAVLVNRGGQLWKPIAGAGAAPVAALARITYLPDPDNETAAVAIALEGGSAQRPDLAAQPQRIAFAPAGTAQPELVVTAHARGSLVLANVVQEFGEVS